ncbi:MAG: AAA family ATPase [Chlamydiales bacterium]|nr:AAA family ATPase [Chlamydiia bacterium]MCP5507941.1 AAA family ATPase [Chlamydiales bacterium]
MALDIDMLTEKVKSANGKFLDAKEEIAKVIVGQEDVVNGLLIALLADGHILVEGLPGLAKTLAVSTLAQVVQCEFKRIQFTPDLLPADLIGTQVYNPKDGTFTVKKGPIFTNILMADEINRAPAKVQAALLEVMQERQVTIAGQTFKAGEPYLVLATQNPIEQEGTYPLPEAQTDRFMMKLKIDYPTVDEEKEIMKRMGAGNKPMVSPKLTGEQIIATRALVNAIYIDDKIIDYILGIVFATRYPEEYGVDIAGLLLYGASPRASLAFQVASKAHAFLSGRGYVTPHDVKAVAHNILRHRLRRSYEAEAEDITPDMIIDRIFEKVLVP